MGSFRFSTYTPAYQISLAVLAAHLHLVSLVAASTPCVSGQDA